MANAVNIWDLSKTLSQVLDTAVSDGTYSDVVQTLKLDEAGNAAAASLIDAAAGQIWGNQVDDFQITVWPVVQQIASGLEGVLERGNITGGTKILVSDGDAIEPVTTGNPSLGSTTKRFANVWSVLGNFSGAVTMATTLAVTGTTTLGVVNASGAVTLTSTLDVDGAVDLDSTLDVLGATTLRATLAVLGDSSLEDLSVSGTLGVTGVSTLGVLGAGATTVTTLHATGATDLDTTLNVDGAVTLMSTLAVGGITETAELRPASNNASTLGTAAKQWSDVRSVLATFSGAVTCSSTLAVTSTLTASAGVTMSSASPTLTIGNDAGSPAIQLRKSETGGAAIAFYSAAFKRWQLDISAIENFSILRYDATGTLIDFPLLIDTSGTVQLATATTKTIAMGELEINGDINHDGTKVGLFGTAPVNQPAAIASLTDNSGGTADSTLVALSAVYVQSEVRNNFADLAAKVNAILAALRLPGYIAT